MDSAEELNFPILCHYKVIAENSLEMKSRLEKSLFDMGIMNPPGVGNHSTQDRYVTFNLDILVHSKEYMNEVDQALRRIPGVKMVL